MAYLVLTFKKTSKIGPKNVGDGDRISTLKMAQNNYLLVLFKQSKNLLLLVQLNESP
jgi:hypothetical protein